MTDQTSPPRRPRIHAAGARADRFLGRAAARGLALVLFALSGLGLVLTLVRLDEVASVGQGAMTVLVLLVPALLGRWLWRLDRPLSDLIDD